MRRCASELENTVADGGRALVFVQTRETASALADALDERHRLDADLFVGQSGEDGLTQDEQLERIEAFREGETNVLVSTSVGEEGLDIPDVDLVVFYEAVASAIRSIQRRGRTGREGRGRVVVLMARGTSDEAAYWTANRREQRMRELVRELQANGEDPDPVIRENPSTPTTHEDADEPHIIVDHRELNGTMARLLSQEGLSMEPSTVGVGDLIVSERVVVERKTPEDFVESIIDGRLMDQARTLKKNYEAPIVVVEGDPFATRLDVSDAAISGAIAALGSSFKVPVLTVEDTRRAADIVAAIARREHDEGSGPPKLRHETGGRSLPEKQQFVLEGLPNVSSTLARRLLEHFGSPAEALSASEEELERVRGIGPTTATAIHEVLHERTETPWPTESSPSTPPPASTTPSGTGQGKSVS
jgi:Fanconi anemia group M protein